MANTCAEVPTSVTLDFSLLLATSGPGAGNKEIQFTPLVKPSGKALELPPVVPGRFQVVVGS